MEKKYEMIDRDYLLKAENLLVDAIMEARKLDDSKLADLIGATIDRLSVCRATCWMAMGEDD